MPRTRDFFLFLTAGSFLVVAIGVTWTQNHSGTRTLSQESSGLTPSEIEYPTKISEPDTLSREDRLARMREKIAASQDLALVAPIAVEVIEDEESVSAKDEASTDESGGVTGPMLCPHYGAYAGYWPTSDISFEIAEGARLVYQEVMLETSPTSLTTTTTPVVLPSTERTVLLQLPIRTQPMPGTSCLSSDVVGVAQDGSLIRNNEAGLYGVFGGNTLIGYALDGFPIYGVADIGTDECGGVFVGGQYGYYLSDERGVVLNCFSALPATLY